MSAGQNGELPATLETHGTPSGDVPVAVEGFSGGRGMRFSYASGTRPLAGYTIKRGIGIGGFGEVYFALNDAGKEVALKKIQRNLDIELRGVRHCLNLKHVNLITLWDIRCDDYGESWVVMEYVPGPSLRDVVEAHPAGMPDEEVKRWFVSTASGVAYLHEHGIVHRDLKPGNIFLDQDEQVIKIGDYGLSKFISCSRRSGQTESVGTFHYMAPEIGKGEYGKEIDIYAMGIILYEMVTGQVPFDGESTQEIIMKHLTLDADVNGIPEAFQRVVSKALRKDPQRRYRSIAEMVADLPWPDIASQSDRIISQHAVGAFGRADGPRGKTVSTADHPGNPPTDNVDSSADPDLVRKLPPVLFQVDRREGRAKGSTPDVEFLDEAYPKTTQDQLTPARGTPVVPQKVISSEAIRSAAIPGNHGEEPLASAFRSGLTEFQRWWNQANLSMPVRMGVLLVAGIVIIQNSTWLLPVVLTIATVYLAYYVGRRVLLTGRLKNRIVPSLREQRIRQVAAVRHWLATQPAADRMTELIGSMLVAAVAAAVLNLLGLATEGGFRDSTMQVWSVFTWQTLLTIAACWTVLVITFNWPLRTGEKLWRLGAIIAAGAVLGAVAFYSAASFEIDLARVTQEDFARRQSAPLTNGEISKLVALVGFFAVLFGIAGWGRQTDPLRRTRLSLLSVGICLVAATLLSHLLNVPVTVLTVMAAVISVSVQLASPWLPPSRREAIDRASE